MRITRYALYLSGAVLALSSTGCFSAAKAGFKAVKGASAHVYSLETIAADDLKEVTTIQLGEVTTDIEPLCPSDVVSAVRTGIDENLGSEETKKAFPGGGKSITLNVACRFFKEKPTIGKEARLDLLVTIVDADGKTLGRTYVEGINESMRGTKPADMARKDTEKLVRHLNKIKTGKEEMSEEEADKETDKEVN